MLSSYWGFNVWVRGECVAEEEFKESRDDQKHAAKEECVSANMALAIGVPCPKKAELTWWQYQCRLSLSIPSRRWIEA